MSWNRSKLCFILDVNVAWLKWPLRRRGFLVYAPGEDFPEDAGDAELLEWAAKTGCIVVSMDRFFEGKPNAVFVRPEWEERYNSWDLTTKIVKLASQIVASPKPSV